MKLDPANIWQKLILFWTPATSPLSAEDAYQNRIVIQISLSLGLVIIGLALLMPLLLVTTQGITSAGVICYFSLSGVPAFFCYVLAATDRLHQVSC